MNKHAILRIARYLMKTRDKGMVLWPNETSLELWCDADVCGNWDPDIAHVDRATAKSRTL